MTDANSDFTPRLGLPFLLPNQAQKHVTVNESLRTVDALLMAAVETRGLSEPPAEPEKGSAYLIGSAPVSDWAGQAARLAIFQDNSWVFLEPRVGWRVWVKDESALVVFEGGDWQQLSGGAGALQNLPLLGIGTEAAEPNRLSVKSEAVLLSHSDEAGSSGDMRMVLNRAGVGDTNSIVFQTNYAGEAEMGLTADGAFSVRTSPDGAGFTDVLRADTANGGLAAPQGMRVGGVTPDHQMDTYQTGNWTPVLGITATGDLDGATGLDVLSAEYVRVGNMVFAEAQFKVLGLSDAAFVTPSTLHVTGLPFVPLIGPLSVSQPGVSGFVYTSIGGAQNTLLGGGVSDYMGGSIWMFAFVTPSGNARRDSPFLLRVQYRTND